MPYTITVDGLSVVKVEIGVTSTPPNVVIHYQVTAQGKTVSFKTAMVTLNVSDAAALQVLLANILSSIKTTEGI